MAFCCYQSVGNRLIYRAAAATVWAQTAAKEKEIQRFFHIGDGRLRLINKNTGASYEGRYRTGRSDYSQSELAAIYSVLGAPFDTHYASSSLRLIEFLDFLEDRLRKDALITITSGYRAPAYNTLLREKGRLAAKASLHQYGMAVDLKMEGVSARKIWNFIKKLGFGGTGYYHGQTVHVDVGPARSWDEKTSGVGTGISDDNKLIGLVTDYDVYRAGDTLMMRFIRMTAFPIGVQTQFVLQRQTQAGRIGDSLRIKPDFIVPVKDSCLRLADIEQMDRIRWQLPKALSPGRYRISARFCDMPWPEMPRQISTPVFEITRSLWP
jgi:uncharacterized protein YcbK (DUF882 family)